MTHIFPPLILYILKGQKTTTTAGKKSFQKSARVKSPVESKAASCVREFLYEHVVKERTNVDVMQQKPPEFGNHYSPPV